MCVFLRTVRLLLLLGVMSVCVTPLDAQTLPAPWRSADVGSPALAGSATLSSGIFTIDAAGSDIWSTSDQFHFVYQPISGDVDVRARIDDLTYVQQWSKAGVMIRGALTAGAAHGFALVSAGKGLAFQRRLQAGGSSTHTAGEAAVAPRWVRLVRQGSRVTAYSSATGTSWTLIGSDTIALGATAYVGIAVTSHDSSTRTTAQASNVVVTPLGLPAGQASADIGGPTLAGSVAYTSGTYTMKGSGLDIWGVTDQFRYVYQQMTGDGTVIARVASLTAVSAWTKAGVMIRETLAADSRHAFALVSGGNGYAFQRRLEPGGVSDHTSGGTGAAPGWLRLTRAGSTFTASRSADGITWTTMGSAVINMGSTVYAGMALTSHDTTALATAVVDNFRVSVTAAASNNPPLVSLTSPLNGATYTAPATISLAASATDAEGQMSAVEFYSGTTLLGRDTTAPYALSWGSVPAGSYTLTAVAIDAGGASSTSAPVAITVSAVTTAPRYVSFTASADHNTTLLSSYRLDVFASGADPLTATALAVSDLGKPTPASDGTITVDRYTLFSALAAGSYIATVSAIGPGGQSRSAPATFTR